MQYFSHARPHRHRTWAQREEVRGLRLDWPGWKRGAKTPEVALETLESYRERYRPVASLAGMAREFDAAGPLEIVEDRVGPGSTDFWGISFSPSSTEHGPMTDAELDREITLLRACWAFFDGVAARVSAEMRKGPRGGGRDRDQIIRHTIRNESEDFAKRVGLRIPEEGALTPKGLREYREDYVAAMRAYNAGEGERPCGRGRSRSSSATPPTTRSTTRGRWRTRTSPPRTGPDAPSFGSSAQSRSRLPAYGGRYREFIDPAGGIPRFD